MGGRVYHLHGVFIKDKLVKNYRGLLAVRFFLGLAETGMYPGCKYNAGLMCFPKPTADLESQAFTCLVCGTSAKRLKNASPYFTAPRSLLQHLEACSQVR